MNGGGLLGFIIVLIVLFAIGAIFFLTIDYVAKNALWQDCQDFVAADSHRFVIACRCSWIWWWLGCFPGSIVVFAVAVLVLIVVLYLIDLFLGWWRPIRARCPDCGGIWF